MSYSLLHQDNAFAFRVRTPASSWLLFLLFLTGLSDVARGGTWLVKNYTEQDGLPASRIHQVIQDSWGRMWFASATGVTCYDGLRWQIYRQIGQSPFAVVERLVLGANNRIWALAAGEERKTLEISEYDGKTWNSRFILSPPDTSHWGTLSAFLAVVQAGELIPEFLIAVNGQGVMLRRGGRWRAITAADGLPSDNIHGAVFFNKQYYLAADKGLAIIPGRGSIMVNADINRVFRFPSPDIRGIAVESSMLFPRTGPDLLWLYGDGWLVSVDKNGQQSHFSGVSFRFGVRESPVAVQPDYVCGLYISNRYEVIYFNLKTGESSPVSSDNGLVSEGANDVFIDFEKNIWIACDRGVSKIASRAFENFNKRDGLLEDEVSAIVETGPDSWVIGNNLGLTFCDQGKFTQFPLDIKKNAARNLPRVLEMEADGEKNIWLALSYMGLGSVNRNREFSLFTLPDKSEFLVTSVLCRSPRELWVGSQKGLFRFKNHEFSPVLLEGERPFPFIRKIRGDDKLEPRFICTMTDGLYVREGETWRLLRARESWDPQHSGDSVYDVAEYGNKWLIGTSAGLFYIRGDYLERFVQNGFFINRPVYFVRKEKNGGLWFGSDKGLIYWDGKNVRRYTNLHGLSGIETNRSAFLQDKQGRIWFGTNRGLSIYNGNFDPIESWRPEPKLRFLSARSGDRIFSMERPVTLGSAVTNLNVTFQGVSFADESALFFRHKLEGFDPDWIEESYWSRQTIRYSGLPPGVYRFHLKVKNVHGVWSREIISAPIIVSRPYYRRWWFFLIMAGVLGLVMHGVIAYISGRRRSVMLEHKIRERTRQLEITERRYRELFLESKDVVFSASIAGKFLDINPAGVEMFGYNSREEMLKVDIPSQLYVNPLEREVFYNFIIKDGYVKDYELEMKKKNGEPITLQVTATALRDENGVIYADRGIMRDITEKKRLQRHLEQSQKMEAIGQLAGGIAHDFNNILSVITGYVELALEDSELAERTRKDIEQVLIAAGRARDLINQILTFSRQSVQERKPLLVAPIVKEVLKFMRSSLPAAIIVRLSIRDDSAVILGDPTQIHQVLMNLCTNAAYAMKEHGGLLEVILESFNLDEKNIALYNDLPAGHYMRLIVADTGSGIDPAHLKRIFEPYFTTKPQGEGSGMGLAVTHGIVKSFGGDIRVYSERGKGSAFHVLLPLVENADFGSENSEESAPSGNWEHILLVEDEAPLAEVQKLLLEKTGYRVSVFTSSMEALRCFQREPFQFRVIVTDLTMPDLTGVQLIEEIRRIRPEIPIILCTGFSETLTSEQIRHLGVNELLLKPVNKNHFALAIQRVLKSVEERDSHDS